MINEHMNKALTKGSMKFSDPNRSVCYRNTKKERSKKANELLRTISKIKVEKL